jgi:hypothetical protein
MGVIRAFLLDHSAFQSFMTILAFYLPCLMRLFWLDKITAASSIQSETEVLTR